MSDLVLAGGRWDLRRSVLALLVGAAVAALAVVSWQAAERSRAAYERAATADYLEMLEPLAMDAGRIVELGVKDGLQQVNAAPAADPALARSARSFARQLAGVRSDLAALARPAGLDDSGFVAAMDGYIATAAALEMAALADPADRRVFVEQITERGRAADDDWDRAARAVRVHLDAIGLPPAAWLPD